MRLGGHYDVHAGDTNNKYYNTDGGHSGWVDGDAPTMQHIVIHVSLTTVLLLRKSFIAVLGRGILKPRR